MHDGRSRAMWSHTSEILALIAEVNRDPKKRSEPYTAAGIDPYRRNVTAAPKPDIPKVSLKSVKGLLMGMAPAKGK